MGFEPCYAEVLRVVQGKLHQPEEVRGSSFYAFSYYYDRAAETHLIGEFRLVSGHEGRDGAMLGKVKSIGGYLGQRELPALPVVLTVAAKTER